MAGAYANIDVTRMKTKDLWSTASEVYDLWVTTIDKVDKTEKLWIQREDLKQDIADLKDILDECNAEILNRPGEEWLGPSEEDEDELVEKGRKMRIPKLKLPKINFRKLVARYRKWKSNVFGANYGERL